MVIVEGLFVRKVTLSVAAPDQFDVFVDLPAGGRAIPPGQAREPDPASESASLWIW